MARYKTFNTLETAEYKTDSLGKIRVADTTCVGQIKKIKKKKFLRECLENGFIHIIILLVLHLEINIFNKQIQGGK